ncbi:hypothetical protein LFYK43_00770 [Ligilactobacillus salitolerans]|uniref:Uncharacterized protein n=1 Tax=Ligilactobacillus salitolerans TaxID=1808352 RepID=A0A401IQ03_9LACO|nr:hypothetical protein [Ligilactobacillus salitolerans]GBG93618.1 hypothetical protein LFYK43_00770 [Ligilactobacillus salitolerans]
MLQVIGLGLFFLIVLASVLNAVDDFAVYSKLKQKNNLSFSAWRKAATYKDIFLPDRAH